MGRIGRISAAFLNVLLVNLINSNTEIAKEYEDSKKCYL